MKLAVDSRLILSAVHVRASGSEKSNLPTEFGQNEEPLKEKAKKTLTSAFAAAVAAAAAAAGAAAREI